MFFYTQVKSATATTIEHRWYQGDRLRQAEGSNKRSGLGLGLAIARHIVELHHGEITASSEGLGRGATFTVKLPVHVPKEQTVSV